MFKSSCTHWAAASHVSLLCPNMLTRCQDLVDSTMGSSARLDNVNRYVKLARGGVQCNQWHIPNVSITTIVPSALMHECKLVMHPHESVLPDLLLVAMTIPPSSVQLLEPRYDKGTRLEEMSPFADS